MSLKGRKSTVSCRRTKQRGSRWVGSLAIALALMTLLLLGGWFVYPSVWLYLASQDTFLLEEINLLGGEHLNQSELQALLPEIIGVNLLVIDLGVVENALLQHPWVKEARARRRLPDRLVITVSEKEPVALVAGENLWALDRAGKLLPLDAWQGALSLPLVRLTSRGNLQVGGVINDKRLLDLGMRLQALRRRLPDVWQMISEVTWDEQGQVILYASCSRTRILLGTEPSWQQILNFYSFLVYQGFYSGMDDIAFVDLRFRGQVIVRRNRRST
jgi:cell division protein FtsQ